MVRDGDCVAIFHSIHRVMKAEKALKAKSLEILSIPVPRQLSSDCGLAIRFRHELLSEVEAVLLAGEVEIAEVWLKQDGAFVRLK
ncbi:Protein of unknown function [Malonomonas rubra DSM 5091]|uniref:Putative Se/S carrier protein-like domain-containing protein n=1 Tax=Malonomonas rubra DSM 5091 TaxID=1122189 RepID=A0A1M6E855_MALRU|nr:DUF3343 domain-containing protein [Malonomonas rubra]SHI81549.1 Protein of unknown function [Malonomonas rubra DSM 5091]